MNLDLTKYKRLFTFGCSFTHYIYPTWADLVAKEMSHAEYYNFGTAGSGNLLISNRIAQANSKFEFTETDLILIMWSSACREDRYVDDVWITPGNVFIQKHAYDKDFVKKYADPVGYIIRDMGLIELTKGYLSKLPCKTLYFAIDDLVGENKTDIKYDRKAQASLSKINDIYKSTLDGIFPSVLETIGNDIKVKHWLDDQNKPYFDSHPSTINYLDYLLRIGFPLSPSTIEYANDTQQRIDQAEYVAEVRDLFPEITSVSNVFYSGLF
jgi:hypothetical protein